MLGTLRKAYGEKAPIDLALIPHMLNVRGRTDGGGAAAESAALGIAHLLPALCRQIHWPQLLPTNPFNLFLGGNGLTSYRVLVWGTLSEHRF